VLPMLLRNFKSTWRGAAAFLSEPMTECGQRAALNLVERIFYFNVRCNTVTKPLAGITFRNSVGDKDMRNHVFVYGAGRPLETIRDTTHGFISTTLSGSWSPMVSIWVVELIYRYEIYATRGILVPKTLGDRYLYPGQAEVAFPSGIAPRYIRSGHAYLLSRDGYVSHLKLLVLY
ncbi:hypothetical protein Tco_0996866, partial [Tanacetum coccineum]